jgi:hypothetical protein
MHELQLELRSMGVQEAAQGTIKCGDGALADSVRTLLIASRH